jgi:hypothetical protein
MAEFGGFTVEETEIPGLLTVEISNIQMMREASSKKPTKGKS